MAVRTLSQTKDKAVETVEAAVTTGPAAAAMIAGGTGAFVVGLMTTLAETSSGIKTALTLLKPVGPLSGKTIVGVVTWLIVWFLLNTVLKDKDIDLVKAFAVTIILIVIGLLLTFPPFFVLFETE